MTEKSEQTEKLDKPAANATANATAKATEKREIVEIRRTPKFLPFMLTGATIGLITGFTLWFATNGTRDFLGYIVTYFSGIGAALGLIAATAIELATRRRVKRVEATKLEG
jgi:hypothetical protein